MESKKNVLILGAAAAGVALLGAALYYIFSKHENEEAQIETKSEELSIDEIKKTMNAEIEKMKNTEKKDGTKLTQDYILNIFYVLTKYTALAKISEDNKSFEKRIEVLKTGNNEEYEKIRKQWDEEENKKMQEIQSIIFDKFETNDVEYMTSYQTHIMKPAFIQKMQTLQQKVVDEVQNINPEVDVPEALTKEVAEEIRDYAKESTQKVLQHLQSTCKNQQEMSDKFMFEVSKLDDDIYIKYGYKNTVVLKAFQKYNLIPKQGQTMGN